MMLNLLLNNWLNRRLTRVIPNPYARAAAVAGVGLLASRALTRRRGRRPFGFA
jgi:hypothetical protein